jgi:hypothetical protein
MAPKQIKKQKRITQKDILEGNLPGETFSIFKGVKKFFVFPKYSYKKDTVTVLACDPGIQNFAYSFFSLPVPSASNTFSGADIVNCLKVIQIRSLGFIESCLSELRHEDITPYISRFKEDNKDIINCGADYLTLERFQARDLKGPRNEVINFNIATLVNLVLQAPFPVRSVKLVIPSQWKRFLTYKKEGQEIIGLDKIYETLSLDKSLKKVIKPHHVDSFLIGIYFYLSLVLGSKKDEEEFKVPVVEYLIEETINTLKNNLNLVKTRLQ